MPPSATLLTSMKLYHINLSQLSMPEDGPLERQKGHWMPDDITKKAHNIRAYILTDMCQKCICGRPTTCCETDNITDLFNTDGYIWCPGTICVPCASIHGHPGTTYGACVVAQVPHMAPMWSAYGPSVVAWGPFMRLCGR